MVNLNAPKAPEMVEVEGQLFRPEDADYARERAAARKAGPGSLVGAQDPVPLGVPRPTDNRRRTARELYVDGGGEVRDPGTTVVARVADDGSDPVDSASGTRSGKRSGKSGDGQ